MSSRPRRSGYGGRCVSRGNRGCDLRGGPSRGSILTDDKVDYAMPALAQADHVQMKNTGQELALATYEIGPVLRAAVHFLQPL